MSTTFPGTTIEALSLEKGSSRSLFDGIFATGGITLSQVSIMTGLEPYLIQNWIKRGFVGHPVGRVYSREQFARIVIINMLRETMQIDRICHAIEDVSAVEHIGDGELYHRYVDLVACGAIHITDERSVLAAVESVTADFDASGQGAKKKLARLLAAMLYAHTAAQLREAAESTLSALQ